MYYYGRDKKRRAKKRLRIALISIAAIGLIATSYFLFFDSRNADDIAAVDPVENTLLARKILSEKDLTPQQKSSNQRGEPLADDGAGQYEEPVIPKDRTTKTAEPEKPEIKKAITASKKDDKALASGYKVISVAHFYNQPNEKTRRKAFINYWNNSYASIKPLVEKNGFIYVVFKNHMGQTTKGWLRKKDLKKMNGRYENTKE